MERKEITIIGKEDYNELSDRERLIYDSGVMAGKKQQKYEDWADVFTVGMLIILVELMTVGVVLHFQGHP